MGTKRGCRVPITTPWTRKLLMTQQPPPNELPISSSFIRFIQIPTASTSLFKETLLQIRGFSSSKMSYCNLCDRSFPHWAAYNQHIENSAAHRSHGSYECQFCDRDFYSEQSRHQHYCSSHSSRYCVDCKRTFMNENNLMQV